MEPQNDQTPGLRGNPLSSQSTLFYNLFLVKCDKNSKMGLCNIRRYLYDIQYETLLNILELQKKVLYCLVLWRNAGLEKLGKNRKTIDRCDSPLPDWEETPYPLNPALFHNLLGLFPQKKTSWNKICQRSIIIMHTEFKENQFHNWKGGSE